MAYAADKKPGELTALTSLATDDVFVVGDTSDASEVAKGITKANLVTDLSAAFATAAQGATADTASQPGHTHTASEVTDFDTEVSNNASVVANTAKVSYTDAAKVAGIETGADVTDATNVAAAGAVMNTGNETVAGIKTFSSSPIVPAPTTDLQAATKKYVDDNAGGGAVDSVNTQTGVVVLDADDIDDSATTNKFTTAGDISKLAGIETAADVTDTVNVTAAGALMDSEVTNLAQVKAFDSADYATIAQGATADSAVQPASTDTLTNKRITKRTGTTASSASLTIDSDSYDRYTVTALAAAMTINAPTGTPTDGQTLVIRIKDNATARALTWNAIFRVVGVTLPTTTVISKTMYIGCMYNTAETKWDVTAVASEA